MKHLSISISICALIALFGAPFDASANPFSDLKNKAKQKLSSKAQKKAKNGASKKIDEKANSAIGGSGLNTVSEPSSELTSLTSCVGLELTNILIGELGDYTFQQGFSKEKRSGYINRRSVSAKGGCILPSLKPRQIAYLEVDTRKFNAMGSSNDWSIQCLRSNNPSAGAVTENEPRTEFPYRTNVLSGKDLMLHCGNSEGVAECAEGSNSHRSGEWDKLLKTKGKTMLSVLAQTSTLAPAQGEEVYCQYYNKQSGKSLFAFQYLRTR